MKYQIIYDSGFIQSIKTKSGVIEYKIGNIFEAKNQDVVEITYKNLESIKYLFDMNMIFYKYKVKDLVDLLFIKKI